MWTETRAAWCSPAAGFLGHSLRAGVPARGPHATTCHLGCAPGAQTSPRAPLVPATAAVSVVSSLGVGAAGGAGRGNTCFVPSPSLEQPETGVPRAASGPTVPPSGQPGQPLRVPALCPSCWGFKRCGGRSWRPVPPQEPQRIGSARGSILFPFPLLGLAASSLLLQTGSDCGCLSPWVGVATGGSSGPRASASSRGRACRPNGHLGTTHGASLGPHRASLPQLGGSLPRRCIQCAQH